jgi:hypothetical protein
MRDDEDFEGWAGGRTLSYTSCTTFYNSIFRPCLPKSAFRRAYTCMTSAYDDASAYNPSGYNPLDPDYRAAPNHPLAVSQYQGKNIDGTVSKHTLCRLLTRSLMLKGVCHLCVCESLHGG